MSQLLSGKHKGRFAAPPPERAHRSPWTYAPIIVLMPLTILLCVFAMIPALTYYQCKNQDTAQCVGTTLRPAISGTYESISTFGIVAIVIGFVLAVVAAICMKRWRPWICWTLAVLAPVLPLIAFLALNGSIGTPFGELGEMRILSPE